MGYETREMRFKYTAAASSGQAFTVEIVTTQNLTIASPDSKMTIQGKFRSNTGSNSELNWITFTAATTISVPAGATLGFGNGQEGYIYPYAVFDGTNKQIAVCSTWKDPAKLHSTVAVGTGSDSDDVLYATNTMSNVAIVPLGRIAAKYATNDWSQSPSFTTITAEPWHPNMRITRELFQQGPCSDNGSTSWDVDPYDAAGPLVSSGGAQIAYLDENLSGECLMKVRGLQPGDYITGVWISSGSVSSSGSDSVFSGLGIDGFSGTTVSVTRSTAGSTSLSKANTFWKPNTPIQISNTGFGYIAVEFSGDTTAGGGTGSTISIETICVRVN